MVGLPPLQHHQWVNLKGFCLKHSTFLTMKMMVLSAVAWSSKVLWPDAISKGLKPSQYVALVL